MTLALIIAAAGSSSRMNTNTNSDGTYTKKSNIKKEFLNMEDGTVLSTSCKPFLHLKDLSLIVITCAPGKKAETEFALMSSTEVAQKIAKMGITVLFIDGGETRQISILYALNAIEAETVSIPDIVLIHDGARPWINDTIIDEVMSCVLHFDSAVPAIKVVDTIATSNENSWVVKYIDRSCTYLLQTPQAFNFSKLLAAHRKAISDGHKNYTDDTTIWDTYCSPVHLCKGSSFNKKITYMTDINTTEVPSRINLNLPKIGLGYDLHRLIENRRLILGGVVIPFNKGEDGHSDGDVLIHALIDAILGAAGLGDIGEFFPSSDAKWKNVNSGDLLKIIWNTVKSEGYQLGNIDCVIALEKPKFLPYRKEICSNIASLLECSCDSVFVKAKTGEGIGEIGKGEAVAAWATCLLFPNNQE